jgi:hypothetical protein
MLGAKKKKEDCMETLQEFARRLSLSVECYFDPCKSYFALKKNNTRKNGKKGVFAYVLELRKTAQFKIDTWTQFADKANVTQLSDGEKDNLMWGSPGVFFFVRKDSTGDDYKKAIESLRAICALR